MRGPGSTSQVNRKVRDSPGGRNKGSKHDTKNRAKTRSRSRSKHGQETHTQVKKLGWLQSRVAD